MPSIEMIVWAGISGLILLMLGIIGYLVKTGFEGIKTELKSLWEKMDITHKETDSLRTELREHKARCDERNHFHTHHRSTDTIEG